MKIIMTILFILQLFIASAYGLLFFQGDALHNLVTDGVTLIEVNFDNCADGFERFLDTASKHELHVSRIVFLDDDTMIIYTTDLTLGNIVRLNLGRFPEIGTREFVSNIDTGEENQVGLMANLIPGFNLKVSFINNPQNFVIDGTYDLHTVDMLIVETFLSELDDFTSYLRIIPLNENEEIFLFRFIDRFTSIFHLGEFVLISVIMFLCMLFSSIHYALSKLKASSIFRIHGYTKRRVIKTTIISMLKPLVLSAAIAYAISLIYSVYMGYSLFLLRVSLLFWGFATIFIIIYVSTTGLVILIHLKSKYSVKLLKGGRSHRFYQACNHILKITFSIALLGIAYFSLVNLIDLNQRLRASVYWEKAQGVYQFQVSSVGQNDWQGIGRGINARKASLYLYLSENYNAFIMNSREVFFLDIGLYPYKEMTEAPPMKLSPHGYRIDISPNFLELNPIETVNGVDVREQINWENNVWNLLVPEHLKMYEEEIVRLYLEDFYFRHVTVANIHRELSEEVRNITEKAELEIHIIYVKDNQYYFSFDERLRAGKGGRIRDPIAVIYTGNIHPEWLDAMFSHSFFFQTSAIDAYGEIFPALYRYNLESVIQRVSPVFDRNARIVQRIRGDVIRLIIFTAILVLASIAVTYNLIANYFEQYKYKLFIKRIYGYSSIRRNGGFIIIFLYYSVLILIIMSFRLGVGVFFIGLVFLVLDTSIALMFERRLLRKSFAEIVKGEH